jgi:glucokinase
MNILAFDFGGTRTRAAWYTAESGQHPVQHARDEQLTLSSDAQARLIERLIALGRRVIPDGRTPDAVGIAAPGPADNARGVIYHSYALPGWENVPLGDMLRDAFGAPVYMENDGSMGALAEGLAGAGRDANPMIYMTISTGIGGGVLIDKKLFTGWSGLASEPGHIVVTAPDGTPTRLEAVASGTALGERARVLLATTDTPSGLRAAAFVDGAAVGAAAAHGDPLALEIVTRAGTILGYGFVSLLHLFSPEAIVLGGSAVKLGELLLAPARAAIEQHVLDARYLPPFLLRPAQFGEDVCLFGAALYAATINGA